jgi:hypothetical protein
MDYKYMNSNWKPKFEKRRKEKRKGNTKEKKIKGKNTPQPTSVHSAQLGFPPAWARMPASARACSCPHAACHVGPDARRLLPAKPVRTTLSP